MKVRLGELESFLESELYRQFSTVPITPSRAASYINNPDGKAEDVVLILAFIDGRLTAFRSLFAGVVQAEKEELRFGWCSGSWVEPGFRRQGLSQLLLKEALNDWNGRLMLTNYSPETESLYIKTGWFKPVHQFEGIRGYLFPKASKLFPDRKENAVAKLLFPVIDFFMAAVSWIKILFYRYKNPDHIRFDIFEDTDEECFRFIENYSQDYLFSRKAKEIIWILKWPWISETNRPYKKNYPFSACSDSFYYRTVKVMHKDILKGVCLFSVREGHLKTLFFWLPTQLEGELVSFLKDYTIRHRLEMLTVYHSGMAKQLSKSKFPFLHLRKISQKIYSSFDTGTSGNSIVQDGDGDRAFT
ncbi:MAG: hypothetical protein ACOC11_02610 [Prolixibacteraceae bacterium]